MTRQVPMFDDEERGDEPADSSAVVRIAVVRIAVAGGAPAMSKAQKTFNRLIAKIEGQRQLLAGWQAFVPQFHNRIAQDLTPLQQRMDEQRLALLRLFDAAHDGRGVTRRERAKLGDLISGMAEDLLTRSDDPALVALHDKYSDISHEEAQQEDADFFKAMAEGVFGVDLDEADGAQSPEQIFAAMARKMQQREADEAAAAPEPPPRPKSAKAQARQTRQQEQEQGATQTVREVYRKLASALHPDRETDPAERARKTALMQRVNQAYEKKDLLQLLELQIQAEQIDPARLGEVGESRLRHYIVVLKEQSQELEQELLELTQPFAMGMPYRRGRGLTPAGVLESLQAEMAELRRAIAQARQDLAAFQDLRQLKAWLKHCRIGEASPQDDYFEEFDGDFEALVKMAGRRR